MCEDEARWDEVVFNCLKLLIQQKGSWEHGDEEVGNFFSGLVRYIRPPKGLMDDKTNLSKGREQWNPFSSNLLNLFDNLAWYTLLLLIIFPFQVISCYLYPLDIFPFLCHFCFSYGLFSLHCFTFPQLHLALLSSSLLREQCSATI